MFVVKSTAAPRQGCNFAEPCQRARGHCKLAGATTAVTRKGERRTRKEGGEKGPAAAALLRQPVRACGHRLHRRAGLDESTLRTSTHCSCAEKVRGAALTSTQEIRSAVFRRSRDSVKGQGGGNSERAGASMQPPGQPCPARCN